MGQDKTTSGNGAAAALINVAQLNHTFVEAGQAKQVLHDINLSVHPGEVVEEKISLSERFGLWVSFYPFSQDEYLPIVAQLLVALGAPPEAAEQARAEALVWALERGSRSGRVAYQFARDWVGRHA